MRFFVTSLLLLQLLLAGCASKSANSAKLPDRVELGTIEVAGSGRYQYMLSGGRDCRLDLAALADGKVLIRAVVLAKDAQGNVRILAHPSKIGNFGKRTILDINGGQLSLTPKLKSGPPASPAIRQLPRGGG